MSTRIERIENKTNNFESRLNQIESALNKRIGNLENNIKYFRSCKPSEQSQTN